MCKPVVMKYSSIDERSFSLHNQQIQILLSDAETAVCVPRCIFSKVGSNLASLFPPIHLAAPEEEDYRIISGAHDLTQEYYSNL